MFNFLLIHCILPLTTVFSSLENPVVWLCPVHHDFGTIPLSVPAAVRFEFKNTGTSPLVIDNVRTPCGCTAVEWPEKPVSPGEKATILVEYNAAKIGYFYKDIKVFFHGIRQAERLSVKGLVAE